MTIRKLTLRQRQYLAGYSSSMSVVMVGLALTDQPVMGRSMTWLLRGCIIVVGLALLRGGLALERSRREGLGD